MTRLTIRERRREKRGCDWKKSSRGFFFFFPLSSLVDLQQNTKKNLSSLPVPDLELRDHISDMHQDHRPGYQGCARCQSPFWTPIFDKRPHIRELPGGLRDRKDEGQPSLVELKTGLALGPLFTLELFQGGEGSGEELQDDGGVDVRDDAVDFFFFFL